MTNITFIDHAGVSRAVAAEEGQSAMEAARNNDIPGIDADCGGMCACATCHVYVEESFLGKLPPPGDSEGPMIEFVEDTQSNSRLACQITITKDLEGITFRTPECQG